MAMFWGTNEYRLDGKARLPLPVRYREELRPGLVLTQGVDGQIWLFPMAEWERMAAEKASPAFSPEKLRRRNRVFFANSFPQDLDNQGRIALPSTLRQVADIKDEVVVSGAGSYLEIWSKERWLSEKSRMDEQAWQIAEATERP